MESSSPPTCPLHGPGIDPSSLMGVRVERVVTSRFVPSDGEEGGPDDIWLIDDAGVSTWITTGSDWCLIVEASRPTDGYDLGAQGRVEVAPDRRTPFERHVGERVVSVQERWEPATGRVGLRIGFESGSVVCDAWGGDLRLCSHAA
ncbi:hypothetical protein CTZ27_10205 [Streptomyces griseocarneus]|nr:hypothetical protein CTZ27_10205 [Streptomyces griseocarneus]